MFVHNLFLINCTQLKLLALLSAHSKLLSNKEDTQF